MGLATKFPSAPTWTGIGAIVAIVALVVYLYTEKKKYVPEEGTMSRGVAISGVIGMVLGIISFLITAWAHSTWGLIAFDLFGLLALILSVAQMILLLFHVPLIDNVRLETALSVWCALVWTFMFVAVNVKMFSE